MTRNRHIIGALPGPQDLTRKPKRRIGNRAMSAALVCLGLTLAAAPSLAAYNPNPCHNLAGVWESLATGAQWTFGKNGSISCTGRCSFSRNHGKEAIGKPIGWTTFSRYKWHNFTLFWSKSGSTAEKCDLARGGGIMAIESMGSFRRIK